MFDDRIFMVTKTMLWMLWLSKIVFVTIILIKAIRKFARVKKNVYLCTRN